jgi:hypothetical protein
MTTTTKPSPVEVLAHEDIFARHFEEVYFATHTFGGERQVEEIEATYQGVKLDADMVKAARARLIPKELSAPITRARDRVYRLIQAYCLPGDGAGCYYVSTKHSEEFIRHFEAARAEFGAAVHALAAQYDAILAQAKDRWLAKLGGDEKKYDQLIGRFFPASADALAGYYRIDFRVRSGASKNRYATGRVKEWFEEAHRNAAQHAEAMRRARYAEPIDRLRGAINRLSEQVTRGKKITSRSFTEAEQALALVTTCIDIVAPELAAAASELASTLAAVKHRAAAAQDAGSTYTQEVKDARSDLDAVIARTIAACDEAASLDINAIVAGRALPRTRLRRGPEEA